MRDSARRLDPDGLLLPLRRHPERTALLSDVDGTLAPIAERPELSALLPGIRETLADLQPRLALLGFISGRAMADAERLVGIPGCAYSGNHGMELRLPGGPPEIAREAAVDAIAVAAFADLWPPERLTAHGIWLEDKGVTLSFHYRTAPDRLAAEAFLNHDVAPAAVATGLRPTRGRMVLEVRPPAGLHKGTAVRALLAGNRARQAIFLGDDRTDLDAWHALRGLVLEGALDLAVAVGVVGPGVPDVVRREADLVVEGPVGALEVLRLISGSSEG